MSLMDPTTRDAYFGRDFASVGPGKAFRPDETELPPRTDLIDHSPDRFQAGYSGSGPAQLALAILADHADDETAVQLYQPFKRDYVSSWAGDEWSITTAELDEWITGARAGKRGGDDE